MGLCPAGRLSANRRRSCAAHPCLFWWRDELDVLAAEEFVERRLEIGVTAHFELARSAQDEAEVLRWVVLVGGVDDQDDVGFAGVVFEDLFGASHLALAVQAPFEVDRDLSREVFVGFLDGEQLVDDQIRLAAAAIDFAFEEHDRFGQHFVSEAGEVFGPHDAADDAGRVFQIEVDVLAVPVAAGLFRLSFLDAGDHAADQYFGAVFHVTQLFVGVRRMFFELVGHLRQRVTGEVEAKDFLLGGQPLRVRPSGSIGQ